MSRALLGTATRLLTVVVALLLLAGGNIAFASSKQPFSFDFAGAVTDAGRQAYDVKGGNVQLFVLSGTTIDPSSVKLEYSLHATVTGTTVSGHAHFQVETKGEGGNGDNSNRITMNGEATITDAVAFPVGTSEIPFYFLGVAQIKLDQPGSETQSTVPMLFESPYWNPFGNPILITSQDSSIVIVATYTHATIEWRRVLTGAGVTGTLGTTFSGSLSQVARATEDLVRGTERDSGVLTLIGLPGQSAPVSGEYHGSSIIPQPGVPDGLGCAAFTPAETALGISVCTATSLTSTGSFELKGTGIELSGKYTTLWGTPAIFFEGLASGTAK